MGLMMTADQEKKSHINERIRADLRQSLQSDDRKDPDLVDDANYLKETKKTGRFTWVWIVLIVLALISLLCILFI